MTNIINHDASFKSTYKLRSKFVDQLAKAGLAENALDKAISTAMNMSEEYMFQVLWAMSFEGSYWWGLSKLHVALDDKSNDTTNILIPSTLVVSFRNELRHQYAQVHNAFLDVAEDPEEEKILDSFTQNMDMDEILSAGIFERVLNFLSANLYSNSSSVEKTFFLLRSEKENYRFGGLRSIGLRKHEATTLLSKAPSIATLMEELKNTFTVDSSPSDLVEGMQRPFEGLDKMLDENKLATPNSEEAVSIPLLSPEKHVESVSSVPSIESDSQCPYRELSSHEVIHNPELFQQFIDAASRLTDAGFDIKEVAENRNAIQSLLFALESLG